VSAAALTSPQVSIILPVYNRKHLIERALSSVQTQTFRDWELLIIDDGSSDGLEGIVLPKVAGEPRYRYMKHARRKLAACRNIGIHAGLGVYITFLDSDDAYEPDHIERRIEYMRAHPDVDFIHGGVRLIGPESSHYVADALDPRRRIHISECCIGATFFGRKSAFLASGGFKPLDYSAESEFLPRIEAAFRVEKVDDPTYLYYTGLPDSICEKVRRNGA